MFSIKIGEAIIHGDKYHSFRFVPGMVGTGTDYEISDDKKTLILRWQETSMPDLCKKKRWRLRKSRNPR